MSRTESCGHLLLPHGPFRHRVFSVTSLITQASPLPLHTASHLEPLATASSLLPARVPSDGSDQANLLRTLGRLPRAPRESAKSAQGSDSSLSICRSLARQDFRAWMNVLSFI